MKNTFDSSTLINYGYSKSCSRAFKDIQSNIGKIKMYAAISTERLIGCMFFRKGTNSSDFVFFFLSLLYFLITQTYDVNNFILYLTTEVFICLIFQKSFTSF